MVYNENMLQSRFPADCLEFADSTADISLNHFLTVFVVLLHLSFSQFIHFAFILFPFFPQYC